MKKSRKQAKGYGLVELVLAIGIFMTIASMLMLLVVDSTKTLQNTRSRAKATHIIKDINSTLIMLKSKSWYSVASHTNDGPKHFQFTNGNYTIEEGTGTIDGLTYSFEVLQAQRDINGILVESNGTVDAHTRLIDVTISWTDSLGKLHNVNQKIYLNDWETNSIVYTTQEEFQMGVHDSTLTSNISGGEVRLQSMFYADWCNPTLSMSSHDLPGQGIASNVSVHNDNVYMGTGGNSSGISFMNATISGEPPTINVGGTIDGYKVNDVYGVDNFALLATDSNSEEVVIFDISTSPFTQVGFFNSAGPDNATSVFLYDGKGFVTHGTSLSIFDLSSFSGERGLIRSATVGNATDIFVDANYIYLTLANSTNDFVIYEYNDLGVSLLGYVNLNSANATGLYISPDSNRAYVTSANNAEHEFYIVNTSNKSGTLPIVGSFDTGAMSPNAVASIDNRAIVVGTGGEEYLVLDITTESAPNRCGGIQMDTGVNALALVKQGINHYTYVVTRDSSSEFKIIRGGPGGGGEDGNGYLSNGEYISSVFDSQSPTSTYYLLGVTAAIPSGTSLKLQVRVSGNADMTGSTWVGPDGTSSTYFEGSDIFSLPINLTGQYIQFKAIFESDTVLTPLLEEVVINYEK